MARVRPEQVIGGELGPLGMEWLEGSGSSSKKRCTRGE